MTATTIKSTPLEDALAARATGLAPYRDAAFASFKRLGFPHRRMEGWRWSDFHAALRNAAASPAQIHQAAPPLADDLAGLKPIEIRIVNGRIDVPANAFPDGVRYGVIDAVGTIAELEAHPVAALNVALTKKAFGIEVAEGVDFVRPILIRHVNTGAGFSFSQCLMRLAEGARATLIETFEGDGAAFSSTLFHANLKDDAMLDRTLVSEMGDEAVAHSIFAVKVEARAQLNQVSLSTGARLCRHETHAHFVGEEARATIGTTALLDDERHNDFTSEIIFRNEACQTRQTHKGVATGKGRNVFQGKFRVERNAQKTDARMNADALLLSDAAETDHKPELEIYADEVQCAHGSTAGALDERALFYMRQRGLSEHQARAMLIEAFIGSTFDDVAHPGVGEALRHRVAKWLEGA